MTVNQIIEESLKGIVDNIWPLCCPLGLKPESYIVYNTEIETPGLYADDGDEEWTSYLQVHLFTKENYTDIRKDIKDRLREAGFIITDIQTFYEEDTGYYHLCFSCYIEE